MTWRTVDQSVLVGEEVVAGENGINLLLGTKSEFLLNTDHDWLLWDWPRWCWFYLFLVLFLCVCKISVVFPRKLNC